MSLKMATNFVQKWYAILKFRFFRKTTKFETIRHGLPVEQLQNGYKKVLLNSFCELGDLGRF